MSNFAIYVNVAGKIVSFFEILKNDMYCLKHEDLISAKRFLKNAQRANSQTCFESNIDKAYYDFMHATTLVKNEELVCAWCGVALCQFIMGDFENSKDSLLSANNVMLTVSEHVRRTVLGVSRNVVYNLVSSILIGSIEVFNPTTYPTPYATPYPISNWDERMEEFVSNKEKIVKETEQLMCD